MLNISDLLKNLHRIASKWFTLAAVAFGLIVFFFEKFGILDRLGFLKTNTFEIELVLIVILFLSQLIQEKSKDVETGIKDLTGEISGIKTDIKFLLTTHQKLFSLKDVIEDVGKEINDNLSRKLTVSHIGLDMVHAWDYVEKFLMSPHLKASVDYRLLILTDNIASLGEVDVEIEEWCSNVNRSLSRIKRDVENICRFFSGKREVFKFSCKKYSFQPYIHGIWISAEKDFCYVSIGRWAPSGGDRYYWGESQYYKVSPQSNDPIARDLFDVFSGFFNHHWEMKKPLELESSNQAQI